MMLMIDNYDSFTYNLVQYFQCLEQEVKVFANDPVRIWQNTYLFRHETTLDWLFVGAVSTIGVGVISLLQAHKILGDGANKLAAGKSF